MKGGFYWRVSVRRRLDFLLFYVRQLPFPVRLTVSGYMETANYLKYPHPEDFEVVIGKLGYSFRVSYLIGNIEARQQIESRFLKQVGLGKDMASIIIESEGRNVLWAFDGFMDALCIVRAPEVLLASMLERGLIRRYEPTSTPTEEPQFRSNI